MFLDWRVKITWNYEPFDLVFEITLCILKKSNKLIVITYW